MTAPAITAVEYLITFTSSHLALKAERTLQQAGLVPRLIAPPRAISSQCGFCLLLKDCPSPDVAAGLVHLAVPYSRIYTRQLIDGVTHYAQQN